MPRPAEPPHPVDIHVGAFLRARRLKVGLSQHATAAALGVSMQQVQKYESGLNRISASRLWAFCLLLKCEPSEAYAGLSGDFHKAQPSEPDPVLQFTGVPHALEVVEIWPRLPSGMRTAVLNLMRAAVAEQQSGPLAL